MARNAAAVLQLLKQHGLETYADLVRDELEPAVRLVARPSRHAVPLGRSKLGGEPHLPEATAWPMHRTGRPMHFLAQVRLSGLPKGHLPRGLLPESGWLYFWWDSTCWAIESDDWQGDGFIVTFEPDESLPLSPRQFPSFQAEAPPHLRKIKWYTPPEFKPDPELAVRMLPVMSVRNDAIHRLGDAAKGTFGRNAFNRVLDFYRDVLVERGPGHRLLGDAFEMQGDMRQECHRESRACGYPLRGGEPPPPEQLPYKPSTEDEKRPWRMLAVFDTDERLGWEWSDAGRLYFWIREQDLAARRFDLAHYAVDSG